MRRAMPYPCSGPRAFSVFKTINASVIADGGEIFNAFADQGADQVFRNAAQAEATHHDYGAVGDIAYSLVGAADHFVHKRKILNEIVDL